MQLHDTIMGVVASATILGLFGLWTFVLVLADDANRGYDRSRRARARRTRETLARIELYSMPACRLGTLTGGEAVRALLARIPAR